MEQANAIRVPPADDSGTIVKNRFIAFLQTFRNEVDEAEATLQTRYMNDYVSQIAAMIQNNKTTIHVNFQHLIHADQELAEAVELEYYRFEPFLRAALQEIVREDNAYHVESSEKGQRELFVAFYNFPRLDRVRAMRADKIGRLMSVSGTVTRSSEVRPELLYGSFTCGKCGKAHANIEQQYQFTEPPRCHDDKCAGSRFNLDPLTSSFVDWQRLRVQENADEVPAGSMPRCIDVICRNEVVELAKAGDRIVFTGSIAVLPDMSGTKQIGEAAIVGKSVRSGDNMGGVSGFKKSGVKEVTYKMAFIACSVQHADANGNGVVSTNLFDGVGVGQGTDSDRNGDRSIELSQQDKEKVIPKLAIQHHTSIPIVTYILFLYIPISVTYSLTYPTPLRSSRCAKPPCCITRWLRVSVPLSLAIAR